VAGIELFGKGWRPHVRPAVVDLEIDGDLVLEGQGDSRK